MYVLRYSDLAFYPGSPWPWGVAMDGEGIAAVAAAAVADVRAPVAGHRAVADANAPVTGHRNVARRRISQFLRAKFVSCAGTAHSAQQPFFWRLWWRKRRTLTGREA